MERVPEHVERCRRGDSIPGKTLGVVVGCAGWSSFRPKLVFGENWREKFSSTLKAYSVIFSFVEVNSTFYKLPKPETARKWRNEVGESFQFSMKMPRVITHEKRFKGVDREIEEALIIARELKAFFLLFQTPKSFKYSPENERTILDVLLSLPSEYTYGLELRGWKNEEVEKLLVQAEFVHVVDPFQRDPVTPDPFYFRLHGSPPGERMYKYRYTQDDLKYLREKVVGREGHVVFNNIWMCEDALRFREILQSV